MRRDKLIWFAAGAGLSALCSVAVALFVERPVSAAEVPILVVYDVGITPEQDEHFNEIVSTSGQMLHACGVNNFDLDAQLNVTDSSPRSMVPLTSENEPALDCVLRSARDGGFEYHIEMKRTNAKTH